MERLHTRGTASLPIPANNWPFGEKANEPQRYDEIRALAYNDLAADWQTVAAVQALEAILEQHAAGYPDCVVRVGDSAGKLVLYRPGDSKPYVLC